MDLTDRVSDLLRRLICLLTGHELDDNSVTSCEVIVGIACGAITR
jgi:hypothetical protein